LPVVGVGPVPSVTSRYFSPLFEVTSRKKGRAAAIRSGPVTVVIGEVVAAAASESDGAEFAQARREWS